MAYEPIPDAEFLHVACAFHQRLALRSRRRCDFLVELLAANPGSASAVHSYLFDHSSAPLQAETLMNNRVVFIQKRSTRGGAQVALSRLLTAPQMRDLNPIVITTDRNGWLTQELDRIEVDHAIEAIPSVRSIPSKLWGNRAFARRVAGQLKHSRPLAIIANNHEEAPLAYLLAKELKTKSAVILRDPYLTKDTLEKYDWDLPDHTLAVGMDLAGLAVGCNASIPVTRIYDAITDFAEPVELPSAFPDTVLVIGSSHPRKGWKELIEAISIADEMEPGFKSVRFVFSGSAPDGYPSNERFSFAGHTPDFF
ncbi:MAG: hypothetical protein ACTS5I_09630, partial [Rhodanobacter sp.]